MFVEERRERRHKLYGCERLVKHYTFGNALDRPLVACSAGHINHRKIGIDFARRSRDFPAVEPPEQTDINHKGMVGNKASFQEGHRFLPGARYGNREAAFAQGILNKFLDCVVVLDDKDCWYFRQGFPTSPFN